MAGMPRSGSTAISAILNQNLDIFASPSSSLLDSMGSLYNQYFSSINKDYRRDDDIFNMIDALPELYYKNYNKKYIIDKNFYWLRGVNYEVLKKHTHNEIKIIAPVRKVIDVISSFTMLTINSGNLVVQRIIDNAPKELKHLSQNDIIGHYWIGGADSNIKASISGIQHVLATEPNSIHLIDYNNFIQDPQKEINSIYDFLNIPYYDHNFEYINNSFKFNDAFGYHNHHKVKETIIKTEYDYYNLFSENFVVELLSYDPFSKIS